MCRARLLTGLVTGRSCTHNITLKNRVYPCDFNQSSGPRKKRSIIAQAMRTSDLFAIRSKVVVGTTMRIDGSTGFE